MSLLQPEHVSPLLQKLLQRARLVFLRAPDRAAALLLSTIEAHAKRSAQGLISFSQLLAAPDVYSGVNAPVTPHVAVQPYAECGLGLFFA
jgi:pectin methylesterase-like acyl-CoA thioesterase